MREAALDGACSSCGGVCAACWLCSPEPSASATMSGMCSGALCWCCAFPESMVSCSEGWGECCTLSAVCGGRALLPWLSMLAAGPWLDMRSRVGAPACPCPLLCRASGDVACCCCGCWGAAPLPWGPRDMLLAAAPPARRLPGPAGGSDDEVPATRLPCCTIMLLAGCIWPNGDACNEWGWTELPWLAWALLCCMEGAVSMWEATLGAACCRDCPSDSAAAAAAVSAAAAASACACAWAA
mmetsp:Transcript_6983/g.20415  ORF Transcript_6983/g.20415 Transcript_6983/m.20415 type:complete len:240 (-) Transcript_6983:3662-4381(-)